MAETLDVVVVTADDVMALPLKSGYPDQAQAADTTSIINDVLTEILHVATTEPSRSLYSHAEWCAVVGASACDLADALASVMPEDGNAPWDAIRLLEPGLPQESNDPLIQRLRALLMDAVPTTRPAATEVISHHVV